MIPGHFPGPPGSVYRPSNLLEDRLTMIRHILITGAAGAIGSALCERFALAYPEAHLTLVDINEAALQSMEARYAGRASHAVWDLFKPEKLGTGWKAVIKAHGPVDILVNCAGIMDIITFEGTGWTRGWKLLAVNMISPLRLMDLALQDMPEGGTIINISSMAGRVPITGCTYYSGAKAGLAMASEIARNELRERNINVVTVYPGPIYSGLESHARSQVARGLVSRFVPTGTPDVIADRILTACRERKARVIYPNVFAVGHYFNGLSQWTVARFSPAPLQ